MENFTVVGDRTLESIRSEIESIKYGYVTITVQDGRVIQIETSKKIRIK